MLFNGPKSLLNSINDIIKEGREQYAQEQAEMDKLVAEKMLSPKQKKIAKVAGDPNKIDAADFAALRAGKQFKEEAEEVDEATLSAKAARHGKDIGKPGKMFDKIAASAAKKYGSEEAGKKVAGAILKKMRMAKEEVEQVEEAKDTPGNGREHQCAIHVKSEQFGEGKTLSTQHAEPDENGSIAWYDVMFDHGIERVMTEDIEVLISEAHTHSKKAMKEEVSDIEEGRGRPRKNPEDPKWKKMETKPAAKSDDDEEEDHGPARPGSPHLATEPDKHIAVQLKVAQDMHDEKGGADVKFANGKTHFVKHDVAGKVLGALDKLKPADRAKVHDHIAQSHENLMAVHKVL